MTELVRPHNTYQVRNVQIFSFLLCTNKYYFGFEIADNSVGGNFKRFVNFEIENLYFPSRIFSV